MKKKKETQHLSTEALMYEFLTMFDESDTLLFLLKKGNKDSQQIGMLGLTHKQMITGWREFLEDEYAGSAEYVDIINEEIDLIEKTHISFGSYADEI